MKPRKPKSKIEIESFYADHDNVMECQLIEGYSNPGVEIEIVGGAIDFNLKQAKKLHAWLGRYIEWREEKQDE